MAPLHIDSAWMAPPKAVIYTRSIPVERPQYDIDLDPPSTGPDARLLGRTLIGTTAVSLSAA